MTPVGILGFKVHGCFLRCVDLKRIEEFRLSSIGPYKVQVCIRHVHVEQAILQSQINHIPNAIHIYYTNDIRSTKNESLTLTLVKTESAMGTRSINFLHLGQSLNHNSPSASSSSS